MNMKRIIFTVAILGMVHSNSFVLGSGYFRGGAWDAFYNSILAGVLGGWMGSTAGGVLGAQKGTSLAATTGLGLRGGTVIGAATGSIAGGAVGAITGYLLLAVIQTTIHNFPGMVADFKKKYAPNKPQAQLDEQQKDLPK